MVQDMSPLFLKQLENSGDIVMNKFRFGVGDTVLMPAGLKKGRVRTEENCMWLEASVPGEGKPS